MDHTAVFVGLVKVCYVASGRVGVQVGHANDCVAKGESLGDCVRSAISEVFGGVPYCTKYERLGESSKAFVALTGADHSFTNRLMVVLVFPDVRNR